MLKLLVSLQPKEIRDMTGAIVSFAMAALAEAAAVFTVLTMVFGVVNGTVTRQTIMPYWIGLAVLLIIQAGVAALGDRLNHAAGFSLVERLQESITIKLQSFSQAFYTQEQLSEVSSVVHKDVNTMQLVIAHLWSRMFASIAVSLILGGYLFFTHWQLGLAMIAGIPVALLVLAAGIRKKQKIQTENVAANMTMLGYFLEFTKGMPILKSYKTNVTLQKRLHFAVAQFGASSTRLANAIALLSGHYFIWVEMSFALVVTFGAYLVYSNTFTIMDYMIFVVMSKEFFKPFIAAESYYVYYIMVKSSFTRIQGITNAPVLADTGTCEFPQHGDIIFENLSFTYETAQKESFTLAAINITVQERKITALVGPSGSGKTTLTNLLLRFYDPAAGCIRIGNTDIRDIPYDTLLTHIAVVMQDVFLFSGTIYENLLMGNQYATEGEVKKAAQQAMIHDEIMALPQAYNTVVGEYGAGLSGGQRQRISIARAFLKDARIIILDEATSNVDPVNERRIQQAIVNLACNRTVIVIAHHLRTIRNADQIVVLNAGRVAETGKHPELLGHDDLYAALWHAQNKTKERNC